MPKPINDYHGALLEKEAGLLASLQNREGLKIEHRSADHLDEAIQTSDRNNTVDRINREAKLLKLVRAAIDRILHGDYGECLGCGEKIAEARLKAVPWAERCVPCQQDHEAAEIPEKNTRCVGFVNMTRGEFV